MLDARKTASKTKPPEIVRRGRKPPPENESKRQRFLRLANVRMTNTIKEIRKLGNFARSSNYEVTEADVSLMQDTLYREVDAVIKEYARVKTKPKTVDFSFDEAKLLHAAGDKPGLH